MNTRWKCFFSNVPSHFKDVPFKEYYVILYTKACCPWHIDISNKLALACLAAVLNIKSFQYSCPLLCIKKKTTAKIS
jgi:hypothetical protein